LTFRARAFCWRRFETVVRRCWDATPKRRPELAVIRRRIEQFYRGPVAQHDGYYASNEIN